MLALKRAIQIIGLLFFFSLGVVVTQAQEAENVEENSRPMLRVVNASLGLPNADVYVGGTRYFQDVSYGYISNYVPVDATNLRIEIRPAGVKDVEPLRARDFPFENNKDYTMVIVGTPEEIEDPWIFEDNNKETLVPGQARTRIVHASSLTPAVEVCLNNQCNTLTYRKFSNYITLDNGHYNAKVRFIGTDELFIYKLPTAFQAGQVYSIFIFDPQQGEVKPRIVIFPDTGQALPHYPDEPHAPAPHAPDGGPGHPPMYPPVTGAFLSPLALMILLTVVLVLAIGLFWWARRQFRQA